MDELIFVVTEDMKGGYVARALGASTVTQGSSLEELREQVRDAVRCHFDDAERPRLIRLHIAPDEVLVA